MEDGLSSIGQVPESPASALSPLLPLRNARAPSLPPLALGRARMARIALRRLSADVAQSLTLISRRGIDCLIAIDAEQRTAVSNAGGHASTRGTCKQEDGNGNAVQGWRLTLSAGVAQPLRDACDREALLDWSGARMRLLYRDAAALSWLAARLNIDSDMPLDDVSARSLRGAAFDDLIARLALTGLGTPHIVEDRPLSAAARRGTRRESDRFSFVVLLQALHGAKPTILAVLEADAFGVNLLAALLQHRSERPRIAMPGSPSDPWDGVEGDGAEGIARPSRRFGLPMVARLVLPSMRLPIADVRALSVGDVVLLGVPRTGAEGASQRVSRDVAGIGAGLHSLAASGLGEAEDALPGYLEVAGRACWRVAVMCGTSAAADRRYVHLINREFGVADDGIDNVNDGANGANGFAAKAARHDGGGAEWTDGIPVRVTFELGTKTVPLGELQRWHEGSILTFQVPFTKQAAIDRSIVGAVPSRDDVDKDEAHTHDTAEARDFDDRDDLDDAQDAGDDDDAHDGRAAYDDDDASGIDDGEGIRSRYRDGTTNAPSRHDVASMGEGISAESRLPVTVRIRVNGAPLGIGELVDVDGQLAVSIVTLFEGGVGAVDDEMRGVHGAILS